MPWRRRPRISPFVLRRAHCAVSALAQHRHPERRSVSFSWPEAAPALSTLTPMGVPICCCPQSEAPALRFSIAIPEAVRFPTSPHRLESIPPARRTDAQWATMTTTAATTLFSAYRMELSSTTTKGAADSAMLRHQQAFVSTGLVTSTFISHASPISQFNRTVNSTFLSQRRRRRMRSGATMAMEHSQIGQPKPD